MTFQSIVFGGFTGALKMRRLFFMNSIDYMKRAITLAEKGRGYTSPNPVVGAVIVKDGKIIGEGYHEKYGGLHAERNALASCTEDSTGADMFVTLEPCCHHGKQPPCTEAIIEAKIAHVFVGSADPNPLVAGKGIGVLRKEGVCVTEGFLKEECDELNKIFFHYITTKRPYVTMKYAMTVDGKIATANGQSQWITGELARRDVHRLRHENAAIMVGIGTVLMDDPMLNVRLCEGTDPLRIVCDTSLKIPRESQLVKTAKDIPTIIATCVGGEEAAVNAGKKEKLRDLEEAGCQIMTVPMHEGATDLFEIMNRLGDMKIDSVLLEGGAGLAYSAMSQGLVNRVVTYIAPKVFGGSTAKTPVGGHGVESPSQAFEMRLVNLRDIGDDLRLEYEVL